MDAARHVVWRARLLTCIELLWAKRLYGIYLIALFSIYFAKRLLGAAWLSHVEAQLIWLWFAPALAAAVMGRRRIKAIRDEREAALALMEFVHERRHFCTAADLTVKAVALMGVLSFLSLLMSLLIPEAEVRLALLLALFAALYSRMVGRELKRLRRELELEEELKKSYEKISG